jgi:peptidoglycan/LPS O-acetylase OafA/YrhL
MFTSSVREAAAGADSPADSRRAAATRLPALDALKGAACLAIVAHHLAFYGPMSDVVEPYAPHLLRWLFDYGRMAVQVFLVIAGFLTAASFSAKKFTNSVPLTLLLHRYQRLLLPYAAALLMSVLVAMAVRPWFVHASVSAEPTWPQLLSHALLLQDVLGHDALSAGVWYVAIDLQLFALALVIFSLGRQSAGVWMALTFLLGAGSLLVFNRSAWLDVSALYFFGSYALGMLAASVVQAYQQQRVQRAHGVLVCMGLVGALALAIDFRGRIALAIGVAYLLVFIAQRPSGTAMQTRLHWLQRLGLLRVGEMSYSIFLIHFPVCLAVNAVVAHVWPTQPLPNALGLLVAFGLSIAAGVLLWRTVESPDAAWRRLRLRSPTPDLL